MINIAIDGPSGAGKSTLSRMLAAQLNFLYADTGALYRAVGYFALKQGVSPKDAGAVEELLPRIRLELRFTGQGQRVILNGEDVSEKIRLPEVSMAASGVSAIPVVRAFLLNLQKDMATANNLVMDGRDIGTVVLPGADLKIFLTASSEDRARRRYEELRARGVEAKYPDVLRELIERDSQDSKREIAPLKAAPDAVIVDTTGFEISKSLKRLREIVRERLGL